MQKLHESQNLTPDARKKLAEQLNIDESTFTEVLNQARERIEQKKSAKALEKPSPLDQEKGQSILGGFGSLDLEVKRTIDAESGQAYFKDILNEALQIIQEKNTLDHKQSGPSYSLVRKLGMDPEPENK